MKIDVADSIWLKDTDLYSSEQLAEISGLSMEEIADLIECGIITPVDAFVQSKNFQLRAVIIARTARRLRDDFQLDRYGMALALALLRRIDALEAELEAARSVGAMQRVR
jgi:chaperone modulatory protein CbpM